MGMRVRSASSTRWFNDADVLEVLYVLVHVRRQRHVARTHGKKLAVLGLPTCTGQRTGTTYRQDRHAVTSSRQRIKYLVGDVNEEGQTGLVSLHDLHHELRVQMYTTQTHTHTQQQTTTTTKKITGKHKPVTSKRIMVSKKRITISLHVSANEKSITSRTSTMIVWRRAPHVQQPQQLRLHKLALLQVPAASAHIQQHALSARTDTRYAFTVTDVHDPSATFPLRPAASRPRGTLMQTEPGCSLVDKVAHNVPHESVDSTVVTPRLQQR